MRTNKEQGFLVNIRWLGKQEKLFAITNRLKNDKIIDPLKSMKEKKD